MPFAAYLICRQHGKVAEALMACPTLAAAIPASLEFEGMLRIEVLQLLVVEDLYGDENLSSSADADCWASTGSKPVLFEADLGSSDFTGYVGKWNLEFLQWLKAVSETAGEEVEIQYDHERGDYPYELAWWISNPVSVKGEVEAFGIQSHDGMTDPEWRREAVRHADGRIEVRVNEWLSTFYPAA